MPNISNLLKAKKKKDDEFYTKLEDIDNELKHYYKEQFYDKIVYCNCDDWRISNFVKYFKQNFNELKIKKLIATCYINNGKGQYYEFDGENTITYELQGNGDYASNECEDILERTDIVVTNPPFSLSKDYIPFLIEHNKKFIVLSNHLAFHYKAIFPYIIQNKVYRGHGFSIALTFENIDKEVRCGWYTNMIYEYEEPIQLELTETYSDSNYDRFDFIPQIINVDRCKQIPKDYDGLMGVPLTFYFYIYPSFIKENDYEIKDVIGRNCIINKIEDTPKGFYGTSVKGEIKFKRLIIKKK